MSSSVSLTSVSLTSASLTEPSSFTKFLTLLTTEAPQENTRITIWQVIKYSIIPFGQVFARAFLLKGSLDQEGLLFPLFLIFPFSLFPMIMMHYGKIKDGPVSSPYDGYIWLPILSYLFFMIINIFVLQVDDESTIFALMTSLVWVILYISLFFRNYYRCIKYKLPEAECVTKERMQNLLARSVFIYGLATLPISVINVICNIPPLPIISLVIGLIPYLSEILSMILWIIGFFCAYLFCNMEEGYYMHEACQNTANPNNAFYFQLGLIMILSAPLSEMVSIKGIGKKVAKKVAKKVIKKVSKKLFKGVSKKMGKSIKGFVKDQASGMMPSVAEQAQQQFNNTETS